MDNRATRTSLRLLLNAEPFGFGPTAAIADCFPHLRQCFGKVGFVGVGHTLDLQRKLPYDEIHDLSGLTRFAQETELAGIFAACDVFLTALDFGMAERALAAGLVVCIYDPLTWYWKVIPPVVSRCHLYVAQNFFGVEERLRDQAELFKAAQVVPPIIPLSVPRGGERDTVLLNLGGLSNPSWSVAGTLSYARLMVESLLSALAGKEKLVIAANAAIAGELAEYGVRNYSRVEMQTLLAQAKFALMTPGLGNIYDAARFCTPTIWLPPANDSQGQQLELLIAHQHVDGFVDWKHLLPGVSIDYSAEQEPVLQQIAQAVLDCEGASDVLAALFAQQITTVNSKGETASAALLHRFGSGGAEQVAALVVSTALKATKGGDRV